MQVRSKEVARRLWAVESAVSLPPKLFISAIYSELLGRVPDQAGWDNYLERLRDPECSRYQIIREILSSQESQARGNPRRAFLMHRLFEMASRALEKPIRLLLWPFWFYFERMLTRTLALSAYQASLDTEQQFLKIHKYLNQMDESIEHDLKGKYVRTQIDECRDEMNRIERKMREMDRRMQTFMQFWFTQDSSDIQAKIFVGAEGEMSDCSQRFSKSTQGTLNV